MSNDNRFKILSIDGGGIKGLYSAVILAKFEEKYGPLHKHFHLICGTSTGGIIALALALGIPAKSIVEFYRLNGPIIFKYNNRFTTLINSLKQGVLKSKYNDENLKKALIGVFGEKKIEDCKTNVLIPTVNLTTGKPCIIKNNHSEGLTRDNMHSLVDIALATSAAPTYFPIQEIKTMGSHHQFSDGGIFANNPSLHGIQESYKFFINKEHTSFTTYSLLSVSTLHQTFSYKKKLRIRQRSLLLWNTKLISLMMDLQSISTHHHIEYLNSTLNGEYLRIESEQLTANENKIISLDNSSEKSLALLIEKGEKSALKYMNNNQIDILFASN